MDRADKFRWLMEVVDRWTEKDAERYAGAFKHLREGTWVREIVVTPGCSVSVPLLKAYLAMEVLGIYKWNTGSKVSCSDIERHLAGENARKYQFDFRELDRCFSTEENLKALEESSLLEEKIPGMVFPEEGDPIPVYLLGKIRRVFQVKLGEYWHMCSRESDLVPARDGERIKWKQKAGKGEEEEPPVKKQNKYMECLAALALHEIFVRELGRKWAALLQEAGERRLSVQKGKAVLEDLPRLVQTAHREGQERLLEAVESGVQEVGEYARWCVRHALTHLVCIEHTVSVEAEVQLAMILERKALENLRPDRIRGQLGEALKFMEIRWMGGFERYNRNRSRYYRKLEEDVEDVLTRYLNCVPGTERRNMFQAMESYFYLVEQKKLQEGQKKRLWEVQCILARPLWCYEGIS